MPPLKMLESHPLNSVYKRQIVPLRNEKHLKFNPIFKSENRK